MPELNIADVQSVIGFLTPQAHRIEAEVNERKFPSFDYARFVPVNTEGDMWDAGTVFYSGDVVGQAEFLSAKGFDMPFADRQLAQHSHGFELMGIGYEWSIGEVQRAAKAGRNLGADKAVAARKVAEMTCYNIAMTGSHKVGQPSEKGWTGLINSPLVTAVPAAKALGAATVDETVDIVNAGLLAVLAATGEAEVPNTLLLPPSARGVLAKRLGDTGETILSYLAKANAVADQNGQSLTIGFVRGLETAGANGTRRMVAYNRDASVVQFHLPGAHEFLPPWQKSSMTYEVGGIMNVGGTEWRRPGGAAYVDGI